MSRVEATQRALAQLVNYSDYQDAYVLPIVGKRKLQEIDVPILKALS